MAIEGVNDRLDPTKSLAMILALADQCEVSISSIDPEAQAQTLVIKQAGKEIGSGSLIQESADYRQNSPNYRIHNPLLDDNQKSYGTMLYALVAIELHRHSKRLYSPGNFARSQAGVSVRPGLKLWQRLERLGLAEQSYGDSGFMFADLNDLDLEAIETLSQESDFDLACGTDKSQSMVAIRAALKNAAVDRVIHPE